MGPFVICCDGRLASLDVCQPMSVGMDQRFLKLWDYCIKAQLARDPYSLGPSHLSLLVQSLGRLSFNPSVTVLNTLEEASVSRGLSAFGSDELLQLINGKHQARLLGPYATPWRFWSYQ